MRALEVSGIAIGEILVNRVTRLGAQGTRSSVQRVGAELEAIAAVRAAFPGRPIWLVPELS